MKFTFGIVTSDVVDDRVLLSIINQNIPGYEIVIVGGPADNYNPEFIKHVPFEDNEAPYTIKKNLITKNATFDNIVYLHDYLCLMPGWYNGFMDFGDDWDLCMTRVENSDGSRFRDWCTWDDPDLCYPKNNHRIALPAYTYNRIKYMYISGAYWVAKKNVMELEPLDETLGWGQSEDVEWSKRVLKKYRYVMNTNSVVKCLKEKRLSAYYVE